MFAIFGVVFLQFLIVVREFPLVRLETYGIYVSKSFLFSYKRKDTKKREKTANLVVKQRQLQPYLRANFGG